jgi:two-component system, sensor histidine kinase LadS
MIRFLAHYFSKAHQCMRLSRALASVLALMLATGPVLANHAASVLISEADRSQFEVAAHFWHEKQAKATVEQAAEASGAMRFMPLVDETMFDLKPQDRLWIRLDVDRKSTTLEHIVLWIPLPLLDSITLHQQGADGKWQASRAGDRVAVATWPQPGRFPRFHLELPSGKSIVYLQVQGSTPLSLPLHMGSEVQVQAADREGFLGLGVIVGVLLTLVLMCMVTAFTYKDRLYLLYGAYMLIMILAVGAYTGLSAYLLWNQNPVWSDAAPGVMAILATGGALYFIEAMLGGRQFDRKLSVLLLGLGALGLPLAAVYFLVPRAVGVIALGVYMIVVTTIGLTLASRAWRRGDLVGKWIFFAYAPLALSVLLALARLWLDRCVLGGAIWCGDCAFDRSTDDDGGAACALARTPRNQHP